MKKIREKDLIKPILSVLALSGPTFSSDLAIRLSSILPLSKYDLTLLDNRNVSNFDQTVSNFISHRSINKIKPGKLFVNFSKVGSKKIILSITPLGLKYLKTLNKI